MLYQLFGVGALAHRGLLSSFGVFVRVVPLAFPALHHSAREGCPGHCDTLFYGTDFEQIGGTFFIPDGSKKLPIWMKSFSVQYASKTSLASLYKVRTPSEAVHMFKLVLILPFLADSIHSHLPHSWVNIVCTVF